MVRLHRTKFDLRIAYANLQPRFQLTVQRSGTTVFTRLNAAAFINFLAFPMRRLFKGGVYSRAAFISKSYFLNH